MSQRGPVRRSQPATNDLNSAESRAPGGDLDVAEADAGIQHGGDEGMSEHVGVHPGHPDPGGLGQVLEPTGRGVPVHPGTQGVAEDRPVVVAVDSLIDGAGHRWGQGHEDDLAALPANLEHPVPVLFAEIPDVGATGFEDP